MNRFLTVLFACGTAVISASALAAPEASARGGSAFRGRCRGGFRSRLGPGRIGSRSPYGSP